MSILPSKTRPKPPSSRKKDTISAKKAKSPKVDQFEDREEEKEAPVKKTVKPKAASTIAAKSTVKATVPKQTASKQLKKPGEP